MNLTLAGFAILLVLSCIPLFTGRNSKAASLSVVSGIFSLLILSSTTCIERLKLPSA